MNVALLGKLVWELTRHSPKLWADFMRQKYAPKYNVLAPKFKGRGSFTWNAMVRAWYTLNLGFKLRLGRGE